MIPAARSLRRVPWFAWALLALAVCGSAAVWVLLSLYSGRQHSWMALLAALDVAWLLRLGRWPSGRLRLLAGVLATAAAAALANWWIVATQLGAMLGLDPLSSALRLGAHHAWTLMRLANGPTDLAWIAAALVAAAWTSR